MTFAEFVKNDKRYENYYFKSLPNEPGFISGLPLPAMTNGPYEFVSCEFHPRLWEALEQNYTTSTFKDCNYPR